MNPKTSSGESDRAMSRRITNEYVICGECGATSEHGDAGKGVSYILVNCPHTGNVEDALEYLPEAD